MSDPIKLELQDGVAVLTLNRPDAGNALDAATGQALAEAVETVAGDGRVRALVLTGAGRIFCVGGDIAEMRERAESLAGLMEQALPRLHRAMARIAALRCPVITAVNGPVGGGGIGLALCGDFVLAAASMKLRGGYSAIGLSPDLGASWHLVRRAGAAQAKRILFLNQPVDAAECLRLGLVDAVHPDEELHGRAQALARELAAGATGSLGRIRDLVDGIGGRTFVQHLDLEARYMIESAAGAEAREGVRAFMEKRAPRF